MSFLDKIFAIAIAFIWGANFVVVRWGLEDTHPVTMTILRFLLTAIPMIFFVKKPDVPLKYVAIYGVLFGSGVWGLVNIAVSLGMTAGMASLLLQISPFLTIIVATMMLHETLNQRMILGIVIAFVGFLTICLVNSNGFSLISLGLMLLSAMFWTMCNTIIKITKPKNALSFTV